VTEILIGFEFIYLAVELWITIYFPTKWRIEKEKNPFYFTTAKQKIARLTKEPKHTKLSNTSLNKPKSTLIDLTFTWQQEKSMTNTKQYNLQNFAGIDLSYSTPICYFN